MFIFITAICRFSENKILDFWEKIYSTVWKQNFCGNFSLRFFLLNRDFFKPNLELTCKNLRHDCNRTKDNPFRTLCPWQFWVVDRQRKANLRRAKEPDRWDRWGFFRSVEEEVSSWDRERNPFVVRSVKWRSKKRRKEKKNGENKINVTLIRTWQAEI